MATRRDDPHSDPLAELKSRGPRPVYLLEGEERVLVDEAVRAIRAATLEKASRDFNLDTFSGKDAPLARIVDAALTLPAFAKRRLVIVDHAEKLDLEGADVLVRYLENPSPTTVLVFVAEKLDARTKVYKTFTKHAAVLRYARPKPKEMPQLIRTRARAIGLEIVEPAIHALVEAVGADAGAAIQALEMLSLYVGPNSKEAVRVADVEALISETREESIFALCDFIGKQNKSAALEGIHAMLEVSREPPLRVLAMIARHYRNLARARSLLDAGVSKREIESAVGLPPFLVDNLLEQARRQPLSAFAQGLEAIAEVDQKLKGGPLDYTRAMEQLILGLAGKAAARVGPARVGS